MKQLQVGMTDEEWDQVELASSLIGITPVEFVEAAIVAYAMTTVNTYAYNGTSEAEYFAKLDEDLK